MLGKRISNCSMNKMSTRERVSPKLITKNVNEGNAFHLNNSVVVPWRERDLLHSLHFPTKPPQKFLSFRSQIPEEHPRNHL